MNCLSINDITYIILQASLILFCLILSAIDLRIWIIKKIKTGIIAIVERGAETFGYFIIVYNVLSLIFISVAVVTDYFKDYIAIIIIFNQILLLYPCLSSSWFRNKTVRFFSRLKKEKH